MAELKGMREALEVIRKLPDGVAPKGGGPVRRSLMRASLSWKKQMEANAAGLGPGEKNTRTGTIRLKDSIIRQRDPDPESSGFTERVSVGYRARAFWGAFVENGTEKQPAQPFMRPVLDQVGDEPIRIFGEFMRRDIKRIVKRLRK